MLNQPATFGGAFADLMTPYLRKQYDQRLGSEDKARSALPPPLEHEGERTQPTWLYGFLKNPEPIRPTTWMALRMPKFNFSDEEALQIVNYFAAVDRLEDPGVGLTAPYLTVEQRVDKFWSDRDRAYAEQIGKAKLAYWTKEYLGALKDKLNAADEARKNAKGDDLAKAKKLYDDLEKKAKTVEELLAKLEKAESVTKQDFPELRRDIVEQRPYATDAYRLMLNPQLCLQCHQIGQIQVKGGAQGPPLDLAAERLRPEWTQRWMANPARLFTYPPNMPTNFAKNADNYRDYFDGLSFEQATALRDVLMNLPKVADSPANRKTYEAAVGGK